MNTVDRLQPSKQAASLRLALTRLALMCVFAFNLFILVGGPSRPGFGLWGGTGPGPGQTLPPTTPAPSASQHR
jgi:hypothetical protein